MAADPIAKDWAGLAGANLIARHEETTENLAAECEQFGRTFADKCPVTFMALLLAKTSDPACIAAAERGRREAIDETEEAV